MRTSRILIASLAFGFTHPAMAQTTAKPDTAAVRAAVNAASAKLNAAYLAGDAAAVAGLFTEDARAEYAGFPSAKGRAAIQSTYDTYFKSNKLTVAETTIMEVTALTPDLVTAGGTTTRSATGSQSTHGGAGPRLIERAPTGSTGSATSWRSGQHEIGG
jgi:uncharacterized protein (TIGR02246 family)